VAKMRHIHDRFILHGFPLLRASPAGLETRFDYPLVEYTQA
jgi:hypothetical protein